jgi:hypothetical protein
MSLSERVRGITVSAMWKKSHFKNNEKEKHSEWVMWPAFLHSLQCSKGALGCLDMIHTFTKSSEECTKRL